MGDPYYSHPSCTMAPRGYGCDICLGRALRQVASWRGARPLPLSRSRQGVPDVRHSTGGMACPGGFTSACALLWVGRGSGLTSELLAVKPRPPVGDGVADCRHARC